MRESAIRVKLKSRNRARRVRAKLKGLSDRPRLSVSLTNQHLYAQCIDDVHRKTLVAVSDTLPVTPRKARHIKSAEAQELGRKFAELALQKGITQVVFDRGARRYHGRVKSFAEGAREGGLKF